MSQENRRCNEDADPGLRPAVMAPRLKPLVWVTLAGLIAASVVGIGVRALADLHEREHEVVRVTHDAVLRGSPCLVGEVLRYRNGTFACESLDGLGGRITTSGSFTLGSSLTDVHEIDGGQPLTRGCGRLGRPGVCP